MADLFDSAHELEQSHIQDGRRDGIRDGMKVGLQEGRSLGLQKGFEIGIEVGHYAGCVRMWRALQKQQPNIIPPKVERSIAIMEECLHQFPLLQPQNEDMHDLLEQLQGKYKTVTAALGKTQQYSRAANEAADGQLQQQQQQTLTY